MGFKQFCQEEYISEGILSRITSFLKKPKKTPRPQLIPTKTKDAYMTHDDVDPKDVPVFKPSFNVKKEEEDLDESRKRMRTKQPERPGVKLQGTGKKGQIGSENRKIRGAHNDAGNEKFNYYKNAHGYRKQAPPKVNEDLDEGLTNQNRKVERSFANDKKTGTKTPSKTRHYMLDRSKRYASRTFSGKVPAPPKVTKVGYVSQSKVSSKAKDPKRLPESESYGVTKKATPGEKRLKDGNDKKEFLTKFKEFRKTNKQVQSEVEIPGYTGPKVGDDQHLTFTKKNNKKNQVLVDIPGKEWHAMNGGVVTKVGKVAGQKFKAFRKGE